MTIQFYIYSIREKLAEPTKLYFLEKEAERGEPQEVIILRVIKKKTDIFIDERSLPISIATLDLTHIDGAFFRCNSNGQSIAIQFIFETQDWKIKQKLETDAPVPITDASHKNAQWFGDVDTWWQIMAPQGHPYRIIQGVSVKCYLITLNDLLQGDEITDEEMNQIETVNPEFKFVAGAESLGHLLASGFHAVGAHVWGSQTFTVAEELRHVRARYLFEKGKKIKIIGHPRGDREQVIGDLVMKLANGDLYIYHPVSRRRGITMNPYITRLDGSQHVDITEATESATLPLMEQYRYVTVSEVWGAHHRVSGIVYGYREYNLADADKIQRLDGLVAYYDTREDARVKWRDQHFDEEHHKEIKFPATRQQRRVLNMNDEPIFNAEENLPYNLLGMFCTRPRHAFGFRKVGDHWYNLDSGVAGTAGVTALPQKTWNEMRQDIVIHLSQGTEYDLRFMVRNPDFIPSVPRKTKSLDKSKRKKERRSRAKSVDAKAVGFGDYAEYDDDDAGEYYNYYNYDGVVGASAVVIIMLIFCLGLAFGMVIYWGYSQKRVLD
eukprot:55260_1